MKKTIIIISSILLVAFAAASTFAWGPGGGRGQGMMGGGFNSDCQGYGRQGAVANLSQDQRDKIHALRQQFIDETYEFRSAKFAKQQEVRMLMETSDPGKAELSKLSQEITDLQKQIRDKQIDFRLNAKKIAPEIGRGGGYGQGCGRWSGNGGQKGFHRGQGQQGNQNGGRYYNN